MVSTYIPSTDTSVQANLRRQALNKKASHRNWREWDAMYDYAIKEKDLAEEQLCSLSSYLPRLAVGMTMIGIAIGLLISLLIPMI